VAPPPAGTPALEAGDLLAGRYRLLREVPAPEDAPTTLWRATDEVLARPVAVKVLPAGGRAGAAAAGRFLEAAGLASALSHPGIARVYDAALEDRPAAGRSTRTVDVAYVVSEWVEGRTLAELLAAEGPQSPAEAVRLAREAAEAVGAAHARGVAHGRVHPGNLLITTSGRLRVTDAAVAAALHGDPEPDGGELSGPGVARDTRDLGAVLYALLTARWPSGSTPQPARGVAAAPASSGSPYAPRQVRAGVPRALDTVVVRALDPARQPTQPAITTPLALAQALDAVEVEVRPPVPTTSRRPRVQLPEPLRRFAPVLLVLAGLLVVAGIGYQTGKRVGELPRRPGALDALAQPAPSPSAGGQPAPVRIALDGPGVRVRDFDPAGDGTEQPGSVPNAFDGDPSTSWSTDGYNSADLGGLKPGVGLLVDFGHPVAVGSVQVGLSAAGADVELRSAAVLADSADGFGVQARAKQAPQVVTLTAADPKPARYWLVWLTRLPKGEGGRYRDGIAELVFNRPS
jgi:hypothetical protein